MTNPTPIPIEAYQHWLRIGQTTMHTPLERLKESDSLRRQLRAFELQLVEEARDNGASWADIGVALGLSKQGAYHRFTGEDMPADQRGDTRPILQMVTGVVHPDGNAVWYGLPDDLPGDRNYAYTRAECATAYQLARTRADVRAKELGPDVIVDDGGIDRGSGLFWDLYVGAPAN
jgi:hypothetical protein